MSTLRKLVSSSCKAGVCGRHILELAPHDQAVFCRQLHGSPALLRSRGSSAVSQQPGRAGLRTSLPLTKPVVDQSAKPPTERPQLSVDPSLLNLQQPSVQPAGNQPGTADNQGRDSRHQ